MKQPAKKFAKKKPARRTVAMPWYRESEWDRLRAISVDPDESLQTYEQWHATASQHLKTLKRRNVRVIKVDVSVGQLEAWAKKRDAQIDAKTRAAFAISQVQGIV